MIREPRSRAKLDMYYHKFLENGTIDPNVHPWVAEAWQKSRLLRIPTSALKMKHRLSSAGLSDLQQKHALAIAYLEKFSAQTREFLQSYQLSLLLLDTDCIVLKSFALPFYQRTPDEIEGFYAGEADMGASSSSIARAHKSPFFLFGPEAWVDECRRSDACSVPISLENDLAYIVTLASVKEESIPHKALTAFILALQYALETYLDAMQRLRGQTAILDALPFAAYHIMLDGEVSYANKSGRQRLEAAGTKKADTANLENMILNYRHTPLYRGFSGIPSYNKEVTWITRTKAYEDIATVVPIERDFDQAVTSVVAVCMPIDELRTMVAHASGYAARYNLNSMVGEGTTFASVRRRAARIACKKTFVLLQGESGTGKRRMAHGIHQASARAGGPFIAVTCADMTPNLLEQELFGVTVSPEISHAGKLELANSGTLFIDEIEKIPSIVAETLIEALKKKAVRRVGETADRPVDVRIISASDCDLKRLTERGVFKHELFELIAPKIIRVPSLRSRREDIPELAEHIFSELSREYQLSPKKLLPETVAFLKRYDWPGNTKQLQDVLEYTFFNTKSDEIRPFDIDLTGGALLDGSWKTDRGAFLKAWRIAGGNVSRMASLLNVSRVTLYRYLKKYELKGK